MGGWLLPHRTRPQRSDRTVRAPSASGASTSMIGYGPRCSVSPITLVVTVPALAQSTVILPLPGSPARRRGPWEQRARCLGALPARRPWSACRHRGRGGPGAGPPDRTLAGSGASRTAWGSLERRLLCETVHELAAAPDQILQLGRKTTEERVASFLVTLSERAVKRRHPPSPLDIPMGRADMTDHLGPDHGDSQPYPHPAAPDEAHRHR